MKPRLYLLLCVAIGLTFLPSCNRGGSNRVKVAFLSNNPYTFWTYAERGTEKAAREFDVDCEFWMPSETGGAPEQRRKIEDLMGKGIKGIAISPNDAANVVDFFRDINKQVPLITQDSDVPDLSVRRCYIGTDNYKAGLAAGDLVKKAVPDGGDIAIYVGALDVQNAVERRKGVLDALAGDGPRGDYNGENQKFGKYNLLGTITDDRKASNCQAKVEDNLGNSRFKDVKCLIGLWEYNPPAMLRGVKTAKKLGEVKVVGFDENEETLQGIKDGNCVGTIVQNPFEFGYQAVKIMAGLARGDQSVLKRDDMDKDGRLYIPHRVIDKDNVAEFHEQLKKLKAK